MARAVSRKKLLRLRDSGRLVVVERRLLNASAERLRGRIVEVGREWLVLLALDGIDFTGWNLLRVRDVSAAHLQPEADDEFVARAVHVRGPLPEPPEEITEGAELAGRAALHDFLSAGPLVGWYLEAKHPNKFFIGRYEGSSPKWIAVRQIDPQGRWHPEDSAFKVRTISRVVVGGRYIDALTEFGDEPPEV